MKKQEIFNTVAAHLLKQNKKAIKQSGACVYLAPDGCKCAAGCLIPPEKYNAAWEGKRVDEITFFTVEVCESEIGTVDLLVELQYIHDDYLKPSGWRESLINLAKDYNLDYSVCQVDCS